MHEIYSGYSLFFDDSHIVIVSTGCRVVAKTCHRPAPLRE